MITDNKTQLTSFIAIILRDKIKEAYGTLPKFKFSDLNISQDITDISVTYTIETADKKVKTSLSFMFNDELTKDAVLDTDIINKMIFNNYKYLMMLEEEEKRLKEIL